ncbi:hypothetical protein [Thiohalophilus thiocyanatoxydans]|uniref:Uncharacterized protein n=1 Tax=Thiohalophilus thiocyanatoxydans TaxID=381308 RepID=A0A4R8J0P4_9GAMM|nr:hypothetical protein [Thiohalophilus thiocyanatoxydans]TDY03729.1 hypothetical protein EDC23_0098 [Thiohalophilus thiocyanatoxydans]
MAKMMPARPGPPRCHHKENRDESGLQQALRENQRLILAVIAQGLLVASVEYVQFLTDYPGTVSNPEF